MLRKYFLLILLLISLVATTYSQTFFNNGRVIWISQGAIVLVDGGLTNETGEISVIETGGDNAELSINGNLINNDEINGSGIINLSGNWTNNSVFNAGEGTVNLTSANQSIGGSVESYFYNLNLNVAGVKTLTNSQHINGTLNLAESEINTGIFALHIDNSDPAAVITTTGFVSSSEGGFFSRKTQSVNDFSFPVGSDFSNPVCRPVIIRPTSSSLSEFNARFAFMNPNDEGYYVTLLGDSVENVNDEYFHIINRTLGTYAVEMSIVYDPADGDFDHLANWAVAPSPAWYLIEDSYLVEESSRNMMQISSMDNFSYPQFVLCNKTTVPIDTTPNPVDEIIIYNSFSPNGDNYNDTWVVENCNNCNVKIFNRNGNIVFESTDNTESWNGEFKDENVPDATYYYIIDPQAGANLLKGSVTIIR